MHEELARRRVYLHPVRWTSLGLSLLEAMHLGMPIVALATTEVVEAVPPGAGIISTRTAELIKAVGPPGQRPGRGRRAGQAAREAALARYGLARFLADWDRTARRGDPVSRHSPASAPASARLPVPARPRVLILRALGLGRLPHRRARLPRPAGCLPRARDRAGRVGSASRRWPALTARWTGCWPPVNSSLCRGAGRPPAVAADLHGNGPASHRPGPGDRCSGHDDVRLAAPTRVSGPWWAEEEHEVDRWCRLLEWWGMPADPGAPAAVPAAHASAGRRRGRCASRRGQRQQALARGPVRRGGARARLTGVCPS